MYPVPVQDYLHIDITTHTYVTVFMTDITGKKWKTDVTSDKTGILDIDCRSLASGLYVLTIQTSENVFTKKIVKQ
jgi:hypothetical protein